MFRSPETHLRPAAAGRTWVFLVLVGVGMPVGCGDVACPETFIDAEGVCVARAIDGEMPAPDEEPPSPQPERCDGEDNDGDGDVDEDFFALGASCGEGTGECAQGSFACDADGTGVVCVGAVGPSPEVCDGRDNDCDGTADNGPPEICDNVDNDCDGLIDEGVLSVREEEVFDGLASVADVDGGFLVTWQEGTLLRFETYGVDGRATGKDTTMAISGGVAFLESDGAGRDVYVTWGMFRYHAAYAFVDLDLRPVVVDDYQFHSSWDQPVTIPLGSFDPPLNPQIVANAQRVVGYRDLANFALIPFGDDLAAVAQPPTLAPTFPNFVRFDVANAWVTREEGDNIRAALLLENGALALDIDIGRGEWPSVAESKAALGVASVSDGAAQLTELNGLTLQCIDGLFCNGTLATEVLAENATGPTGIAYNSERDVWFLGAGRQIIVVGRNGTQPVVNQTTLRSDLPGIPNRIDVVVSGGTAAVMQSSDEKDSTLTFMGCF